jgi:WD40 repeat protein
MFEFRPVAAPYPGLRPFEPHESEIFFGREGHTDRLLEILQRERFLAVIGPSGCGKSSLVRAGLLPGLASGALGTGSAWRLALFRPGGQPLLALAQALLGPHALGRELLGEPQAPAEAGDVTAEAALLAAELRRGGDLAGLLATAAARRPEGAAPLNLLVLADQFEEVFTYVGTAGVEADESEALVDLLLAARADQASRVHAALTLRTDFLGNCVRFLHLPEAINRAQYLTPRLGPEEMARAIAGPARVFGGDVDSGLVAALIAGVGGNSDQLPVLQHALARMWREAERANPDCPRIDGSTAESVGGVTAALNQHAEEVFGALAPERQALAEILFRAVTERRESGGQEVRRPQSLAAIADWAGLPPDEFRPVIETYAAPEVSFLHYGRELRDRSVIDLTHEALIRQWARLREWVADEFQRGQSYRRWAQRAEEFAAGTAGLLAGGDLARALDWWNPGNLPSTSGESEARGAKPAGGGDFPQAWQPNLHWAGRYSERPGEALEGEFERTRRFIIDSRDEEQRRREAEKRRLEEQAEAERQRAKRERRLADEARTNAKRAEAAERQLTLSLFESQLTHGSLLARVEDYAEARRVLADSTGLDADIPESRRHARNLLAGYVELMGGRAEQVYTGAGAALSGGVAVSPDGKLLAAAGERGTLVLFDAESGKLLRRLEGHDPKVPGTNGSVKSVVFDHQGRWLLSGGEDGRILRWSLPAGEKLGEWQVPDQVGALVLSPDGTTLASGGTDANITLWSAADGKKLRTLKGHTDSIANPNGLAFSPDGERLASASFDNTARVWDWRKGKSLLTLQGHSDDLEAVAFSPDGVLLATASDDKQVILWDAATGRRIRTLRGHQNIVFGLAFGADGRQLFSTSRDNTLRLWDIASGVTRRLYQGHEAGLWSVAWRDGHVYTAANDATVRRWNPATPGQWLWETGGSPQAAAIAPDGHSVAVGMRDGALRLYGLPDGDLLFEQEDAHGSGGINRIAYHGDGGLLATAGMDGKAKLWRVEADGKRLAPLHTLEGHTSAVHAIAFSPDRRTLATAGYDGRIGLFGLDGEMETLFEAHFPYSNGVGGVLSVEFDATGKKLLSTGSGDREIKLWDLTNRLATFRKIATLADAVQWASLSPNGREAAAVGREHVVSLHDLANPGATRRLVGHEQTVFRAIYSPDGRQLATVGGDMTVRLWDLDSLRLLFTLRLPTIPQPGTPPLWDFDFRCTPAGDCWIAVPLTVGRVAVYRLPYAHPPATAGGG